MLQDHEHALLIVMEHSISDARSMQILLRGYFFHLHATVTRTPRLSARGSGSIC